MGETLNLLFKKREDDTYELQVKENWSGHIARGSFVPPFSTRQLNSLHKKLNALESGEQILRNVGYRLFRALCGSEPTASFRTEGAEQSVQAMLRHVIQRTLRHRGTVALTFSFSPDCDEFLRYPWELLHNGEHFLLASGVFTLTRALLRPEDPIGSELPVQPPLRILYLSATPRNCIPLETGRSLDALRQTLTKSIEDGRVVLDTYEQVTFDQLVEYMGTVGGSSQLNDAETAIPCYVVHFDGQGTYGRLCPDTHCQQLNEADARQCVCGLSLKGIKPRVYLSFCNEEGNNQYIDTQSLCALFVSSDVRLMVISAYETRRHLITFDSMLATSFVMANIPAVVTMPFSAADNVSPTFIYHFYEALIEGRTLEEALARTRHALLPTPHAASFIPALYRQINEKEDGPVPLLVGRNASDEPDRLVVMPSIYTSFVGRERELHDLGELLTAAVHEGEDDDEIDPTSSKLPRGIHHIALTGPIGIGKSALAIEATRRTSRKFAGGVIGVSLLGGKSFGDALIEIIDALHVPIKTMQPDNLQHREGITLAVLRTRASREQPCLLLVDGFEEIKDRSELEHWHHFLCSLPQEVVVLLTSRSNPTSMSVLEGTMCRWYVYGVGKMTNSDLMKLFTELAATSGLDQRIHLDDPQQQKLLREICELLDGYPLGAELIFGTERRIEGKLYTPEAATRSLEEVRDELIETPLAGIGAVLDVSYRRLSLPARLLLSYVATFRLPFSSEQIKLIVAPEKLAATQNAVRLHGEYTPDHADDVIPADLVQHWQEARDELVQAALMQFDGRVYTIHQQVRNFALAHLPIAEQRRVHRVVAAYYMDLPQPSPEEWFVAFEHLEGAGEQQDIQTAVRLAVRASRDLSGRGYTEQLMAMLRKAETDALRMGDKKGTGQIQCCMGAILRQRGQYGLALPLLTQSLTLHRQQNELYEAAWALYELAMLSREVGNFKQAGDYAQEALTLFRDFGNSLGEAWMQMVLGEVSRGQGSYYEALGHFDIALNSFRSLYKDEGVASTLRNCGTVHEALGNYNKALMYYEEALRIFNILGQRAGQGWVLVDRSVVYTEQGRLDIAEQECLEAITIFREQSIRRGEGWALRLMGEIAHEGHRPDDARDYFEEAEAVFRGLGDRVELARILNSLGTLLLDEHNYQVAKECFQQALTLAQEQGVQGIDGDALRGLGDVARIIHDFIAAEAYYQEAVTIAIDLKTPMKQVAVLIRQGMLNQIRGEHLKALDFWIGALDIEQKIGSVTNVRSTLMSMDPFPDQLLINLLTHCTHIQAQKISRIFKIRGTDTARTLVKHLIHKKKRIQAYIQEILNDMPGNVVVPALIEALKSQAGIQDFVRTLILKYPREAIPALVNLLPDHKCGDVAETILLEYDSELLSNIWPDAVTLIRSANVHRTLQRMVSLPFFERPLRVFLYHSSNDLDRVWNLRMRLKTERIDVWLAEEDVLPGQDWRREVTKAINSSDLMIVCVSQMDDVRKEAEYVLQLAIEKQETPVFILPIRFDECDVPYQMKRWQWIDLFTEQDYGRLLQVLAFRANQIINNYYWEHFHAFLRQTIFDRGCVDPSALPDIPITYIDELFKKFMQIHADTDLEYQADKHTLHLRTAQIVRQLERILQPMARKIADSILIDDMKAFENRAIKLLQEFSEAVGLQVVKHHHTRDYIAFLIETGNTFENIQIPQQMPFLVSPLQTISDVAIEHLRSLLLNSNVGSMTQVAVLLLFCDNHELGVARQRIVTKLGTVRACDVVVFNHLSLLEIVAAKEPEKVLCNYVLSQMNLVAVAPYTIAGPTPPHFFFGREQQIREISDHLATTSYILIGGRRIGKTSMMNRLHSVRLPDYGFYTLFLDCSTYWSYDTFLSTPTRDWKPELPVDVPTTLGELLHHPPQGKPLILLLDEADKCVPADRKDGWPLFNKLRSLINSRRMQVILSGERTLLDALRNPLSPLFNFGNLMLLGPLEFGAIEELVTRPMKHLGIEIAQQDAVVRYIYEFTSGHPNIVQRLCSRLIELLNQKGIRQITLYDVQAITDDPHFQEIDFLQTYWENATQLEKIITLVLSREIKEYHLRDVWDRIIQQVHIQPGKKETKEALDRLVELRSILKHTRNGYEFAVKAFPLVLERATTVEDLLEVLAEEYLTKERNVVESKE